MDILWKDMTFSKYARTPAAWVLSIRRKCANPSKKLGRGMPPQAMTGNISVIGAKIQRGSA
jgi:hypothetical protein